MKCYYIYNPTQANFYVQNGCKVLATGIHKRTHKTYWKFGDFDTVEVYQKWCELCRKINKKDIPKNCT